MNLVDWIVLLGTMLGIAGYGAWRTRHTDHLAAKVAAGTGGRESHSGPDGNGEQGAHMARISASGGCRCTPAHRNTCCEWYSRNSRAGMATGSCGAVKGWPCNR